MNKKILVSLSVIAAVAAIAVGGTVAYFSDVETSSGNVFAAGSIDLKIDNTCHLKGDNCPDSDSNWQLTDLQDGVHKFFNFADIKPGDWGEDTISLHVYDNDAWGWMKIDKMKNYENGCTEPETDEDTSCENPGEDEGELLENLDFFIWMDDGDNVYEEGERILHESNFEPYLPAACVVWQLGEEPLIGSQDYYVGMRWCFGMFDSNLDCDGTSISNNVQSDSLTMDVSFIVVQSQNNLEAEGGPTCP